MWARLRRVRQRAFSLHNLSWKNFLLPALSVLLLYWVARTISLQATVATLRELGATELILLIAINLAVLTTFSGRWWLLLRTLGYRIAIWRLMGYRLTAFAISYFTPGSHFGGEPYQVYAVSHYHRVPVSISLAAITLDKVLEMLINLAMLLVGALLLLTMHSTLSAWIEWQIILYSLVLLAIPVALLVALWQGRHPITGAIALVGKLIRRPLLEQGWAQTVRQSEEQAGWLCQTRPRMVGLAFVITLCTWAGVIWEFWLLTEMLGLNLSLQQLVASLVAARVAILLPVPAGLGALEAGQMVAMEGVGLDPNVGAAIAVVIRARDVVSGLAGLALGGAHIWQRVELDSTELAPVELSTVEFTTGELPPGEYKPVVPARKISTAQEAQRSISPP